MPEAQNRLERAFTAFVERRDQALFEELKRTDSLRPTFTVAKLITFIIALLIHAFTLLLPILGLLVMVSHFFVTALSVCCGILLIWIAWFIRPRFNKPPENIASREKFPALYAFVDEVAAHLHTLPIDAIVINEYYNASYQRFSFRQARCVTIGYPLWMHLTDQERIALIGHELAHDINGDFTRNFVVNTALNSLVRWISLIYPACIFCRGQFPGAALANLFMWVIAEGLLLILFALRQLMLYESRRAEYLADYIGASTGGTEATISMQEKFRQRYHRPISLQYNTHPPHAQRIEFLKARAKMQPEMSLSSSRAHEIEEEMRPLEKEMSQKIEKARREGRYY